MTTTPVNRSASQYMGKGGKTRIVPVLPAVREAMAAWLGQHPDRRPRAPLFVGARGDRLNAGVAQRTMRDYRGLAGLPEHAHTTALKELERLNQMPPMAPEVGIIRTYVDWILDLPWSNSTEAQSSKRFSSIFNRNTTGCFGLISNMGLDAGAFCPADFSKRAKFALMSCSSATRQAGESVKR